MFNHLNEINTKPEVFGFYTASDLWADPYRSENMLKYHLNSDVDLSSRKHSFIEKSVAWIESKFLKNKGAKLIDFGCGPGLYSLGLAKKGAQVTGVDFSKNSIEYAKKKAKENGLEIEYIHANYLDPIELGKFDLAIMIMCDYCALGPMQRNILLKKINGLLKEGGALLMDVYTMKAFEEKELLSLYEKNQLNQFWFKEDYYCFLNSFKYEKEKVSLDKYSLFTQDRHETIYNWLQYYDPDTLKNELEPNGFKIENFYKDVAGTPFDKNFKEMAVVAFKN